MYNLRNRTQTKQLNRYLNQKHQCTCLGFYKISDYFNHIKTRKHIRHLKKTKKGPNYEFSIVCNCGGKYKRKNCKVHFMSTRHLKYVKEIKRNSENETSALKNKLQKKECDLNFNRLHILAAVAYLRS